MKFTVKLFLVFVLLILTSNGFTQSLLFPQDYLFDQLKNKNAYYVLSNDTLLHTSIFPQSEIYSSDFDSINFYASKRKWISRKLLQESLIHVERIDTLLNETHKIRLSIDPLFNLSAGLEKSTASDIKTFTNTRGAIVFLRINQNFQFQTAFTENQSVFPNYLQIEVEKNKEVLGQGRWKNFKINGYDYAMASGVFNWKISKHVALFGGHGKQKIGHGYRTFFISDQAFNFPFLRFDFSFLKSKIHYSNLYGVLMNLNSTVDITKNQPFGAEPLLQKKPFSYQYLSVYPSKRIQVALFQGIVWPAGDAKNNVSILPHYLNPFVFSHLAVYGFYGKPLVLAGIESKIKLTQNLHIYYQLCTDGKKDTSKQTQSMGFQLGTKWYDAFGLKNLFLQFEYNEFTNHFLQYASPDKKLDYRHYNGPLSYNTGTSEEGAEIDFILAYRYKRFLISEKMVFFLYPSFQHFNFVQDSKLSFILQPKNNTNLSLGMMSRGNFVNFGLGRKITDLSNWFYFSFSTSLYNIYLDIR